PSAARTSRDLAVAGGRGPSRRARRVNPAGGAWMRTDAKITTPIARPHLPERDRFMDLVADLFDTRMLSNFGKYAWLLEQRAAEAIGHARPYCVSSCDVG